MWFFLLNLVQIWEIKSRVLYALYLCHRPELRTIEWLYRRNCYSVNLLTCRATLSARWEEIARNGCWDWRRVSSMDWLILRLRVATRYLWELRLLFNEYSADGHHLTILLRYQWIHDCWLFQQNMEKCLTLISSLIISLAVGEVVCHGELGEFNWEHSVLETIFRYVAQYYKQRTSN